jgi:hypothetical protein
MNTKQYNWLLLGTLFWILLCAPALMAQTQPGWSASVFMQPFPSPYLADWENNPTVGSLTVTNMQDPQKEIILELILVRTNGSVLASGRSHPITIPTGVPTQINSDRFIDWNTVTYDASIKDQVIRSGRLPEGEYEACVTVRDSAGTPLVSNSCGTFTIVYPDPPILFLPASGDSLTTQYPVFSWTPVQVPVNYRLQYVLRVAEILPGQTPRQALQANIPQYLNENISMTNFQYPFDALTLDPGKLYAWQVQAVDEMGYPPATNEGRSEIWTFVTKQVPGQQPLPTPPVTPLIIKLVPESIPTFTSFDGVVQQLEAGSIEVPYICDSQAGSEDTITILARDGWSADNAKQSWVAKGTLWGSNTGNLSSEVLFAAAWGPAMDVSRTILAWKSRIAGFTGFVVLSCRDFELKAEDLPGELAVGSPGDTSFFAAFTGDDALELKGGCLNLLGKFDLSNGEHETWTALGVDTPYVKVSGTLTPKLSISYERLLQVGRDAANYGSEHELEAELSGEIPVWRPDVDWMEPTTLEAAIGAEVTYESGKWSFEKWTAKLTGEIPAQPPVTWLQEVSLEGTISVEKQEDTLKVTPEIGGKAKITAGWLDKLHLNNPLEVKLSVGYEWTDTTTTPKTPWGEGEVIVTLGFDDLVRFEGFENVFKVHDPKIEWNYSKWKKNEGGVKLEAAFDIAQIENVGTIEMELEKTAKDSTDEEKRRARGLAYAQKVGKPTPFKQAGYPPVPKKTLKERLSQWLSQWKPKITAKFDPIAVQSLKLSLLMRTLNLISTAGNPDFLDNFPALEELSMSFTPGTLGSMVVWGRTSYQNSSTAFIVASAESPTKKGFILGLKPENWSIKNYFPDLSIPGLNDLSLSNVTLVFSNVEGVMPSTELSDEEFEFYSAAYGSDAFTVVIKEGLNLIATIPSENLMSNSPLVPLMNKLGIEQGNILLQGSLGKKTKDIYLFAEFPSMHPEGSPEWFRSGQAAIEINGSPPSIGLAAALNVAIEDDEVTFLVNTTAGRQGLILSGGMVSQEGWESPFGIQWLTLNKVMMLLGVTPTGSVQLGFEGDMVVGEKDIRTAVLVAISPVGVPTNFMFDGESEAGFGVSDLVMLQNKIAEARSASSPAIPLDNVPPLHIKDANLKFAPKDSPELGISRGMTVGGLLQLKPASGSSSRDLASVLFDVGDEGLIARADIDSFTLGPVTLQEASMDLTLTRSEQYFALAGRTDLGFADVDIQMNLTKTSALFHADTKIFNAFQAELEARGELNLTKPAFMVHAKMQNDFNDTVASQLRRAIKDIVANRKNDAKTAADNAYGQWQDAVNAMEAARKRWANLPALPHDRKANARKKWQAEIVRAAKLRAQKELADGKERRWNLASKLLADYEQRTGSGNFIVIREAEFDADLATLKTGAVKMMALDAAVGGREFNLQLSGWNFKNMGASVKGAAQNIADRLLESFE